MKKIKNYSEFQEHFKDLSNEYDSLVKGSYHKLVAGVIEMYADTTIQKLKENKDKISNEKDPIDTILEIINFSKDYVLDLCEKSNAK